MLDWKQQQCFVEMIKAFEQDEIVLAASDTVLGLFACLSEKSKLKLDAIKVRNNKPYIVMLGSIDQLDSFTDQKLDESMMHIIKIYWPGPLTIIFLAKKTLPLWLQSSQGTIAIRIPDHEGLQKVLQHIPGLFTTSANISDQPLPKNYAEINPEILKQVQLVCCDRNVEYDGPASTIIDVSSGSMKIIRQGVVIVDSN